ncbi:MAG: dihydropteroate synthase [Pirellulaceae bacterium]
MGIVNVTPDSFSDGGAYISADQIMARVESLDVAGAQIVDLGAESTRPGARPLTAKEEWSRLDPVLPVLLERYRMDPLRPRFSLDTYHPEVARRGLELGIDIINDVSGLSSPAMLDLARASDADFVAMHHLSVPASTSMRLPRDIDPIAMVESWLLQKLETWDRSGLDLDRILFDPGVGFGKTSLQSLALIQHAARFRRHGLRVLVGHSRKSFMRTLANQNPADRDGATLGASLHLCTQGVDVIRVHNVELHTTTYRGWMQFQARSAVKSDAPDSIRVGYHRS